MGSIKCHEMHHERVAYVFQGGGALGAYQLGAYEALYEHGYTPDWVVGTSIGSINGAILVGNPPEKRIERMREFWDRIATPDFLPMTFPHNHYMKTFHSFWGAQMALAFGQPGFFKPKIYNPWFIADEPADQISFYDTSELKQTLEELIDFDLLNDSKIVLKVGAVLVNEGRLKYFNNVKNRLGPEHIMASCALPPGFPSIKIDGEQYWDAGVQSNTPLNVVLDARPHKNTLCFMIDLFGSIGRSPRTMADIMERQKDIQYSSHSKRTTKLYSTRQNLRHAISLLGDKLPEDVKQQKEVKELLRLGSPKNIDVVHLVYDATVNELESKDYNFAKTSLTSHARAGYENALKAFAESPWLNQNSEEHGVTVYTAPDNPQQEEEEFYD